MGPAYLSGVVKAMRRRKAQCNRKCEVEKGTGVHETEARVCVRSVERQVSKFLNT